MQPTNLYEYYKSQGQNLPSIADRTSVAKEAGITEPYSGTAQQNTQLLSYLQNKPAVGGVPTETTQPAPTETIGSAFNFSNPAVTGYENDPIYKQYQENQAKLARGESIVDQEAIRQQKLAEVQDRINSLNQVYAGELARVKQVGQGNIGSGTAILASRGLAGSMRGEAIRTGITDQNLRAEQAVEAERNAAIQAIYSGVNSAAQEEARLRKESMLGGAKAYIENLKGTEERKAGYTSNVVAQLIAQGIDPKTMSPEELNGIATQLGVKTSDILSRYQQAIYEKSLEEQPEDQYFNLSEGQSRYRINPETGEVEQIASVGKTYAPKSGGSGSGSGVGGVSSNQYASDLDAIIGNTVATIPSKFGQEQFQAQLSRARNDADKISLISSVVLKNAPAPVKQDFSNQAIAVSNIDKAIAEIDNGAKSGFINSKLQKGFNLVGKDYDPSLAAIASYITSAIQPYRNSVTGAAWGSQEEGEYQQLFGSTTYSPTELKQRLTRLKEIMKDKSAQGLNVYVNPMGTYDNPFVTGTETTMNTPQGNTVTVYSIKTGKPAQIPSGNLQQALSSGLFRQ
jgi:hypothetical protein